MKRARTGLLPRPTYVRDARLFVIAVEGEREEPWYFDGLVARGLIDGKRIRLVVLPATDGLSAPEHVAARLAAFEATHALIPADPRWLVLDVDRHHNLQSVLNEADRQGWRFAVSNPCFEVWLQLHLRDSAVGADSAQAKAAWGILRNEQGPGWFFERVHVRSACSRGHPDDVWAPPPPGTTLHRLVAELVP
jgi:hypothetical protein